MDARSAAAVLLAAALCFPAAAAAEGEKVPLFDAEAGREVELERVVKSEKEWRAQLRPEQFEVTRRQGTERAFSGKYHDFKGDGIYECVACGNDLFDSKAKYDSGTGWPSYWEPVSSKNVGTEEDNSFSCGAPRSTAPAAAPTWATCSTTARLRRANATASIPRRLSSRNGSRSDRMG